MSKLAWRFPRLDDGDEQGINNGGIATFKGAELYDNLAREICQNSLDAKAEGEKTVIVEFNSRSLRKNDHSALVGLDKVIQDCEEYWKLKSEPKLQGFLREAKSKLAQEYIDFLVISDYKTKGLSGAKAEKREKSVWRALTHSNGVTQKEQGSGGSYGIGKNAPFACSSFRTIFYNSWAIEDNVKAFQGVARLVTHIQDEEETQGVGFFQNATDRSPIFGDDTCLLRDQFARSEYGTDVIIAGFKKTPTWAEDIEKAILSNFFVAIIEEKLIVKIDGNEINRKTIASRLKYYADIEKRGEVRDKKISPIMELYEAVTSSDHVVVNGSIIEDNDVTLYIKKDDNYSKIIAEMRSIGMVVRTRHNNQFARYAAVMVVSEGKLNELLKEIEPPQHNKWDPEIIEDNPDRLEYAKSIRAKLIRWTNDTIVDCCRTELPGEMDLEGVSAYLPYDEDDAGLGGEADTEDHSPDSVNSVENPERKKTSTRKVKLTASKVKGRKDEDVDPSNEKTGGKRHGSGGTPDPNGEDDVKAPTPGDKAVNVPKIISQRIIQMPSSSAYRVALVLEEDCPVVHISLKAIGDDGTKEKLRIKEYKIERAKIPVNSEVMVLRNMKGKVLYEIFLYFEYAEKMLLDLLVY